MDAEVSEMSKHQTVSFSYDLAQDVINGYNL